MLRTSRGDSQAEVGGWQFEFSMFLPLTSIGVNGFFV
jgi:hypothetical protein